MTNANRDYAVVGATRIIVDKIQEALKNVLDVANDLVKNKITSGKHDKQHTTIGLMSGFIDTSTLNVGPDIPLVRYSLQFETKGDAPQLHHDLTRRGESTDGIMRVVLSDKTKVVVTINAAKINTIKVLFDVNTYTGELIKSSVDYQLEGSVGTLYYADAIKIVGAVESALSAGAFDILHTTDIF